MRVHINPTVSNSRSLSFLWLLSLGVFTASASKLLVLSLASAGSGHIVSEYCLNLPFLFLPLDLLD